MKKILKYFYVIVLFFCVGLAFYGCSTSTAVTAYQIAVEYGFEGTEEEWLASLVVEGDSAYELAVKNGYVGTEQSWIDSLKGKSAYELAVDNGYEEDVVEWLTSLFVVDGGSVENFSVQSLFELGVSLGEYTEDLAGYNDFMKDYLATLKDSSNSTLVEKVSGKCVNQVVSIYTQDGAGSGVFYEINESEQYAYIITNYHVVVLSTTTDTVTTYTPATDIYFYTYGAETVSITTENEYNFGDNYLMAEYVGGSADYDIAVLKVSGAYFTKLAVTPAMAVTFADTKTLQPGSAAIAIGNPVGEGISVTSGVVSVDREEVSVSIAGENRSFLCLRLDTSINGGNSGGGVFNSDGNLIGIVNAKYSSSQYENIANAILANNVKNVTENIIYFYELNLENELITDKTVGVHKYLIGYSYPKIYNPKNTFDPETFTNIKTSEIVVLEIVENSVAQSIGLAVGDIVRGLKVKRAGSDTFETMSFNIGYDLNDFMLTVREGDEIVLIVNRGTGSEEVTYESVELTSFIVDSSKYIEYKNNGLVE